MQKRDLQAGTKNWSQCRPGPVQVLNKYPKSCQIYPAAQVEREREKERTLALISFSTHCQRLSIVQSTALHHPDVLSAVLSIADHSLHRLQPLHLRGGWAREGEAIGGMVEESHGLELLGSQLTNPQPKTSDFLISGNLDITKQLDLVFNANVKLIFWLQIFSSDCEFF